MSKSLKDLNIYPPKKANAMKDYDIDPRLPNIKGGIQAIISARPHSGKSTIILNLFGRKAFFLGFFDRMAFCGASVEYDDTLKPLIKHFGNCFDNCSDATISKIINFQTEQEDETRENMCLILDDCLSMDGFSKRDSEISRLSARYRHILKGKDKVGALIFSNQRIYGSIPLNIRASANVWIIGRMNFSQLDQFIKEFESLFGGEDALRDLIAYCLEDEHSFFCGYLDGDNYPENLGKPVAYKNFNEKIFPSEKYPRLNTFVE